MNLFIKTRLNERCKEGLNNYELPITNEVHLKTDYTVEQ